VRYHEPIVVSDCSTKGVLPNAEIADLPVRGTQTGFLSDFFRFSRILPSRCRPEIAFGNSPKRTGLEKESFSPNQLTS